MLSSFRSPDKPENEPSRNKIKLAPDYQIGLKLGDAKVKKNRLTHQAVKLLLLFQSDIAI